MKISIYKPLCYSALGQKPNQEDSLFPAEAGVDTRVFLVCDGMGGHEHGEVASACVAETVGKFTSRASQCGTEEMKDIFEAALSQAYANLDALDQSDSPKKMGTTLTFLAFCTDGVLVAHIGDSRVYQLRPGKGIIFQTRDHSLVNDLIAAGELSEAEARDFPQRNVITRAVQPHQEYPAKATYRTLTDIREGDLFFLCCDGVVEQLDNDDLCALLLSDQPLESRLDAVRACCLKRGTRDNNTAYLVGVAAVEGLDEVKLSPVGDSVRTMAPNENLCNTSEHTTTQPMPVRKNRSSLWVWLVALVVAILAALFLFSKYEAKKEAPVGSPKPKSEKVPKETKKEAPAGKPGQVQGPVTRTQK